MSPDNGFEKWAKDFHEDVLAEASAAEDGEFRSNAFFRYTAEILVDAGTCLDPTLCPYSTRGMKVSGYDYLEDANGIDLFFVDFDAADPLRSIGRTRVGDAFAKLGKFFSSASRDMDQRLEEASEAFGLAQLIKARRSSFRRVRLFFLTNGRVKPFQLEETELDGVPCSAHVWDIERLYQVVSLKHKPENIKVDFTDWIEGGVPCVRTPEGNDVYDVYLAILPGRILSDIYAEFGQRLLERNVRAFLQTRGKVNRGILDTLNSEPEMFLAYNNGISTTADYVETVNDSNGGLTLVRLGNLQIVNGGQTTASLHNAEMKHGADLADVNVQMKLTVLKDLSHEEKVIPLISRFANSQTKINVSDFAANDLFHVALERLSRSVWVPNPSTKATTKWFYERSRGSYLDELGRQRTPAQQRKFKEQFPSTQKITKTLMAKYEMSWSQRPQKVSLGAEKNFAHFTAMVANRKNFEPDERYFKHFVAKAILFRRCDSIARKQEIAGYKANVVTYTVAWLSRLTAQRLDLDSIWVNQDIPADVESAMEQMLPVVWDHVTSPPREGMNVTEWCKKDDCWNALADLNPPSEVLRLLEDVVVSRLGPSRGPSDAGDEPVELDPEERKNVQKAGQIEPEVWYSMANWGKEIGYFTAYEKRFLFNMGRRASRGDSLTPKQAEFALQLQERATEEGFVPTPRHPA